PGGEAVPEQQAAVRGNLRSASPAPARTRSLAREGPLPGVLNARQPAHPRNVARLHADPPASAGDHGGSSTSAQPPAAAASGDARLHAPAPQGPPRLLQRAPTPADGGLARAALLRLGAPGPGADGAFGGGARLVALVDHRARGGAGPVEEAVGLRRVQGAALTGRGCRAHL